jgi:adenylate cyclase class 2
MQEVEIKFRVIEEDALLRAAAELGFKMDTPATHETNTLYDTPDRSLRQKGQLLRLRRYGERCVLTHKSRPPATATPDPDRHKKRIELETRVSDCNAMVDILHALGYEPCFTYEKYRSEWSDGEGQLVVDVTPLGILAELEGDPEWIDRVAAALGVQPAAYMTESYGTLFAQWQQQSGAAARNMTFEEMGVAIPARLAGAKRSD